MDLNTIKNLKKENMKKGIIKRNSINECDNDNIKLILLLLFVCLIECLIECFCGLKI